MATTAHVVIPVPRVRRWVDNFGDRHGETALTVTDGVLIGRAVDGSTFTAHLPFDTAYDGVPDLKAFAGAAIPPATWGLLLVRKGGFAIARMRGEEIAEHKIGQRHVQGRTKAGGQSQQRFARRRDNQARQAFEAAADHAARILGIDQVARRTRIVAGGDHTAVAEVLTDVRLGHLTVTSLWLAVPDPRRAVLDEATREALAVRIDVTNAG